MTLPFVILNERERTEQDFTWNTKEGKNIGKNFTAHLGFSISSDELETEF